MYMYPKSHSKKQSAYSLFTDLGIGGFLAHTRRLAHVCVFKWQSDDVWRSANLINRIIREDYFVLVQYAFPFSMNLDLSGL